MKNERKDTWDKPNLAERFLYHTRIGRFYVSFDRDDQDIIKVVVILSSITLCVLVYLVVALVS